MIFFIKVGPNLAKKFSRETDDFYKFLKGSYNDSVFLYNTNCEEISKVIDKMASKSSCGVDGISSKVRLNMLPNIYPSHCLTFLI